MITEKDLLQAIAECQGQRNPNSSTCIKLAAFYTILDHIQEKPEDVEPLPMYSYDAPKDFVTYDSDTEFGARIHGLNSYSAWSVIDELMTTLSVINPRLYDGVMRKL